MIKRRFNYKSIDGDLLTASLEGRTLELKITSGWDTVSVKLQDPDGVKLILWLSDLFGLRNVGEHNVTAESGVAKILPLRPGSKKPPGSGPDRA